MCVLCIDSDSPEIMLISGMHEIMKAKSINLHMYAEYLSLRELKPLINGWRANLKLGSKLA